MSPAGKYFSTADQCVAFGLAFLWIAASLLSVALGFLRGRWTAVVVGLLGLFYGLVWLRAAWMKRRLRWKEALWPWKRS